MAQPGYYSCLCHGWLYKEDGSEKAREEREHRREDQSYELEEED